jgi:hypothetical protein
MNFKTFLLVVSFFICANTKAQLFNVSLTDSLQPIIYIGAHNVFQIENCLESDNVYIRSGFGLINTTNFKPGRFSYYCREMVKSDTLRIYKNDTLLMVKGFRLEVMPVPVIKLGGLTNTVATVDEIIKNNNLIVEMPGCLYKHGLYVMNFMVQFTKPNGNLILEFPVTQGNRLSEEQITWLKTCKPGQKLVIHKPKANCKSCQMPSRLFDLELIIK